MWFENEYVGFKSIEASFINDEIKILLEKKYK